MYTPTNDKDEEVKDDFHDQLENLDQAHKQHNTCFMDFKLGTWNVFSFYQPGALDQLLIQLDKYSIDIAAVQEIRWTEKGSFSKMHYTMFYSCNYAPQKNSSGKMVIMYL